MSYDETVMKDLLRIIPQKGKVEWIGIRSKKKEELSVVESVKVEKGTGLVGDHFKGSQVIPAFCRELSYRKVM